MVIDFILKVLINARMKKPEEIWCQVSGTDGKYEVSSLGRVRSRPRSPTDQRWPIADDGYTYLRLTAGRNGYVQVVIGYAGKRWKRQLVHRLVLSAFRGDAPIGYEANHLNKCRSDNRLDNLEYVSRKENLAHANHGRVYRYVPASFKKHLGTAAESERRMKAYQESQSDTHFAALVGATPEAVRMWRIRHGLPAKCQRGRPENKKPLERGA